MDRAGAVEMLMPVVQPAGLWQETGRFDGMGAELLRFKDRHDRDFVIQPTSEEVVTDIARAELRNRAVGDPDVNITGELPAILGSQLTGGPARPPRPAEDFSDHPLAQQLDEWFGQLLSS